MKRSPQPKARILSGAGRKMVAQPERMERDTLKIRCSRTTVFTAALDDAGYRVHISPNAWTSRPDRVAFSTISILRRAFRSPAVQHLEIEPDLAFPRLSLLASANWRYPGAMLDRILSARARSSLASGAGLPAGTRRPQRYLPAADASGMMGLLIQSTWAWLGHRRSRRGSPAEPRHGLLLQPHPNAWVRASGRSIRSSLLRHARRLAVASFGPSAPSSSGSCQTRCG